MTTAKFTIDGSASTPPGYDATISQVLTLQLEDLPALDARTVLFEVTQSSKDAPALVFAPTDGMPSTPGGTVDVTMPGSGVHSYVIKCTVNDGQDAAGVTVAAYTYSRLVAIKTAAGLRKTTPAERTEYDATYGWGGAQNDMVDAIDDSGLADATASDTANTIMKRDGSRTTGLSGITVAAGDSWVQTHTVHASGAGNTDSWAGQNAAAGTFDGGKVRIKGGNAGDGDSHAGAIEFSLGPESAGDIKSAAMKWFITSDYSGTPKLQLYSDSGTPVLDGGANGLGVVATGAGSIVINAAAGTAVSLSAPSSTFSLSASGVTFTGNFGAFGVAQVARPSAYTQTYSTATKTLTADPSAAYTGIDNAQGGTPYAQLTDLNDLRTKLKNVEEVLNAVINDQQALGWFQ